MSDEIDEQDLPPAGNSKGRIYPPIEETAATAGGNDEDDPQQATHGDAAAVRDDAPEPNE